MAEKAKISSVQMFLILFLSRVFTLLSYSTLQRNTISPLLLLIVIIFSFVVDVIVLLPFLILNKRYKNKNIIQIANMISSTFGKIVGAVFFLICICVSAMSVAKFEFFLTSSVYTKASNIIICIMFVLVSAYCVYMGIEALSRFSFIVFCFFVITVLFVTLANIPKFDFYNIIPFDLKEINMNVVNIIIELSLKNAEYFLIFLMISKINGNPRKTIISWLALIVIVFDIISLFFYGVLGQTANTQLFPFYTLASVAEFSIFQRLDALHIGVWVFIALIKTAIYIFFAAKSFSSIFPKIKHKFSVLTSCTLVLILSVFLSHNLDNIENFSKIVFTTPLYVIIIFVLPLIMIFLKKKNIKQEEVKDGGNDEDN